MEPYGALIRLKTAGQGEADRLIEHRKMNLSLNKPDFPPNFYNYTLLTNASAMSYLGTS